MELNNYCPGLTQTLLGRPGMSLQTKGIYSGYVHITKQVSAGLSGTSGDHPYKHHTL